MTEVTLRGTDPCPVCGYHRPALRFAGVRVNARSMREINRALLVIPGRCTECGWHGQERAAQQSYRLDPEDQAKVDAIRARRAR